MSNESESSFGFSRATVSKYLLLSLSSVATLSSLLNFPSIFTTNYAENHLDLNQFHLLPRLILSKFFFLNAHDLITGGLLIYHFRWVERLYGSRKYFYFLVSTSFATLLEWGTLIFIRFLGGRNFILPQGPYSTLFAILYAFQHSSPRVMTHQRVLGVPTSFHSWIYILSFNLLVRSWPSALVPFICGYASGALYIHTLSPLITFSPPELKSENSLPSPSSPLPPLYQEEIQTLKSMGFEESQIQVALHRVNGDVERAIQFLLE